MRISFLRLRRWFALFAVLVIFSSSLPLTAMAAKDIGNRGKSILESEFKNMLNLPGGRSLSKDGGSFKQGEVLVKFKKDRVDVSRFLGRLSVKSFELSKGLEKKEILEPQNLALMKSKTNETTEQLIERLKNDPQVEYVQPNYQYYPLAISTNDPRRDQLWALENTGQTINGTVDSGGVIAGTNNADINGKEALDISTGNNVIVAVIDTGVAYNHPDLSANMWDGTNCKDENGNAFGGCNYGFDFEDGDKIPLPTNSSHGTHIAGTIAAVMNNGKGIIGVAPSAKIMALKNDLTTAQNVAAINFAKQNGAKIINASWGGPANDLVLKDAISTFTGLFIAAAGNSYFNHSITAGYPCDYDLPNIICVAATDQNDALASFSDYGATSVDVGAPGVNILSTIADTVVVNETFESIIPPAIPGGWVKTGNWGTYNLGGDWGKVLYGDAINVPYAQTANSTITSSTYNLNVNAATIDFRTRCDTEYNVTNWTDYMALEFSSDGGSTFAEVLKWDEYAIDSDTNPAGSAIYHFKNLSIPNQYLTNNFEIRFRWFANENADTGNGDGCLVDDVKITKFSDGSDELYDYYEGTSMAAPHVVGAVASVLGYDPSLTAAQVKSIVETTGDPKASLANKTVTGKRINLFNALNMFQPVGGFDNADVIPAGQITQSNLGDGVVTVNFRLKDGMAGLPMTLKNFEYSVDGGSSFQSPANGDASLALSLNWNNNNYISSTDFSGTVYSFTINTKHADLSGLNGVDQNDVIIRFKVNDGAKDSALITTEQFRVNNVAPTATLTKTPTSQTISNRLFIIVGGDGVVTYQFSFDGGALSADTPVADLLQMIGIPDGPHILEVFGKDAEGNVQTSPTVFSWLIDTVGPTGTITNASGNPTNDTTPTLNLTITDAGVGISGAEMRFSCDNATWTAFEPFQSTKTDFNVSSGLNGCANADGTKTVYAQLKDSLGNISTSFNTGVFSFNSSPALAQLTLTPSNPSNDRNPQFIVGGTDILAYKFQIDNGGFSAETGILSNIQLSNLSDGSHTIQIIGKNNAGTWQLEDSPTEFTWLVDATGPVVTITNTSGSPTNIVTPVLTLSINDAGVGTTSATVRFSCDSATWTDFEPFQLTKNNFNVRSGLNGCETTDGAKIVFAQAQDSLLNIGEVAQTAEFTLDTTPPDITGLTSDTTPVRSKTWDWDSSDASAVFRFSIDQLENGTPDGEYGIIVVKTATQAAGDGVYYLHVQSKDALGNESAVTTVSAVLDNTAPTATLANTPNNPTKFTSINVTVGGEGVTHYKFKIDAGDFGSETPIATPIVLLDLTNGEHTLEVIGRDIAGNYQAELSSTRITWSVDTTLVTAVLGNTPVNPTNVTTADIEVSGDNVDFYQFKLDEGRFGSETPVSEHIVLSDLAEGTHQLFVLGKSTAGSYPVEAEATVFSWTVDLTPPAAILTGAPTGSVTATSATITVSGEGVTHYRFILDTQPLGSETPVATPIELTSLGIGSHTLKVMGRDAAGNYQTEANAATAMWTVAAVPAPVIVTPPAGGGGGGGMFMPTPTPIVQTPVKKVLGAKTQRIRNGAIVKLLGKKQYYLIQSGKRVSITLAVFKKKYSKKTVIELDKKTLDAIPLKTASKKPAVPSAVVAPAKIFIEVSYASVRVRDGIGYNATILDTVKKGRRLEVIEEKDGWYKIVWGTNGSAWIEGKWVKKIAETSDLQAEQKFIEVLYNSVRIRGGIGYNAVILGRAARKDRFEVLAEQNGWFNIKMPNGESAWIEGKWVKKIVETTL